MNKGHFICLRFRKLIEDCKQPCNEGCCANPWNVCKYLRLTHVELGPYTDLVCTESVMEKGKEAREYVRKCLKNV